MRGHGRTKKERSISRQVCSIMQTLPSRSAAERSKHLRAVRLAPLASSMLASAMSKRPATTSRTTGIVQVILSCAMQRCSTKRLAISTAQSLKLWLVRIKQPNMMLTAFASAAQLWHRPKRCQYALEDGSVQTQQSAADRSRARDKLCG